MSVSGHGSHGIEMSSVNIKQFDNKKKQQRSVVSPSSPELSVNNVDILEVGPMKVSKRKQRPANPEVVYSESEFSWEGSVRFYSFSR